MEFLKQWCFCVCISLIIAVIFSIFTPRGRMKSFYKIMISLFVLISFIYPLQGLNLGEIDIKSRELNYEDESYNFPYENAVNKELEDLLKNKGIIGSSVSSKVDVDYENGEIDIKSVRVAVSGDCNKEQVKSIIFENTGINAEVVSLGE